MATSSYASKYLRGSSIKYGRKWNTNNPALIELMMIRKSKNPKELFKHNREFQSLVWPTLDHHRWSDLALEELCKNKITVLLGPGSSGKTHYAAKFFLTEYWAWPNCTTILASSTDVRSLQLRIWGEITMLRRMAKERAPWLPGHVLESRHSISTDTLKDDDSRDFRNGLICIPCLVGGQYVGISKYVGIKNKRVRLLADECQFMGSSFLDSVANLSKNVDFKAAFLGNPVDPIDPLGKAAEPVDGWNAYGEPDKTIVYQTKFLGGVCVNFVGTDTPNNDFDGEEERYPYLISKRDIDETIAFWGKDSLQYYSQCKGIMKSGAVGRRVITMDLCRRYHAFDEVTWSGAKRTKIYGLDLAYSGVGGDRCVGGIGEIGASDVGHQILLTYKPSIIPVSLKDTRSPEDQIAEYVYGVAVSANIDPRNIFYDSTGRGTMGAAFARVFGKTTPVPVEFGGRASKRPVRMDLFVYDEKKHIRRLKLCDEHYQKFVTELWFSTRYAIEANQIRGLDEEVAREGCMREWRIVASNKIEIESKDDTKKRMGRSPDLYDWFATLVEGARQRGFHISRIGASDDGGKLVGSNILEQLGKEWKSVQRSKRLSYAS